MDRTKYSSRTIPRISLHDFEARIDTITAALVHAAETDGFFVITDHGIPPSAVEAQFLAAERFFALPDAVKQTVPLSARNTGWERRGQIRPSTCSPDQKESYQMQFGDNMAGAWVSDADLPGFRAESTAFMWRCQQVSVRLMRCFARGLGFEEGKFAKAHDVSQTARAQTVLRALHYFEVDEGLPVPDGYYRAGEHADWDFLTLLFQHPGQSGLEICPGREVFTKFGHGDVWTKVEPVEGEIVCNIGDLLMSWSDDRFKSTFHRVKTPSVPGRDYFGPRYSMAYFNQPNTDCEIQGPLKKYPMVTGSEFTQAAMRRNYEAMAVKRAQLAQAV